MIKGHVKNICDVIFKLISNATENSILMQHLLVDLKQVVARQQIVLVELQNELMHQIQTTKFQQLNDGHGMCLKHLRNFLNHNDATQNIESKRKLNLDFVT